MKSVPRLSPDNKPPRGRFGCGLLETCYPAGKRLDGSEEISTLGCRRLFVKRGKHLYEFGDPISSIYSVMAGTFKTCTVTERGEEQVMGFYVRGAILGLEAMATGRHAASAIALKDSQVCVVAAQCLEQHCLQDKSVAQRVHAAMAKEINARQRMILMLGRKTAEERIATFLIELAGTYFSLGYSSSEMYMPMTRAEIGSYVGLTLETVSRILSSFQDRLLLTVHQKHIRILDIPGLERLMG